MVPTPQSAQFDLQNGAYGSRRRRALPAVRPQSEGGGRVLRSSGIRRLVPSLVSRDYRSRFSRLHCAVNKSPARGSTAAGRLAFQVAVTPRAAAMPAIAALISLAIQRAEPPIRIGRGSLPSRTMRQTVALWSGRLPPSFALTALMSRSADSALSLKRGPAVEVIDTVRAPSKKLGSTY